MIDRMSFASRLHCNYTAVISSVKVILNVSQEQVCFFMKIK